MKDDPCFERCAPHASRANVWSWNATAAVTAVADRIASTGSRTLADAGLHAAASQADAARASSDPVAFRRRACDGDPLMTPVRPLGT